MYLIVNTRPDIVYVVSCLSFYMSNPVMPHWNASKWLLRCLKAIVKHGLIFAKCLDGNVLNGYQDSNYVNGRDNMKSTTSYVFTLCGCCINGKSQMQRTISLSTIESEYVATTEAFKGVTLLFTQIVSLSVNFVKILCFMIGLSTLMLGST
ncbi:unnamed protein product [Cuscuta epithymum]|uniref:Uncharacterized protein n=1 Tax=Cuscuta epithymum TaxID=186058 RepID=A0AAV0C8H7_9ASTE|nr:unnamed protein product [Cuscuta epithymum]